jgi:type VI secretion system protein VasJ
MPDEITFSDIVLEFVEPIPGDSPTGTDAANTEEYFKLNMEIQKTLPDYKKCLEYSDIILKEKSKDLKVAVWFCFALFRTEKIKGLRDGLAIILQLLRKYDKALFPQNDAHRSKTLQFLNTSRFFKLVENEQINKSNADFIIETKAILDELLKECEKQFTGNVPVITAFVNAVKEHAETAAGMKEPPKEQQSPAAAQRTETSASAKVVTPSGQVVEQKRSLPSEELKVTSDKDAVLQLKKLLTFFFEDQNDAVKKERIPELHIVFGLSRQLQWGRLFRPPDTERVTQIEAPNQIIQGKVKEWFNSKSWDKLIPRVEINFLKGESEFQYWLDAHRYVVKGLEQLGGNYSVAAEDIKTQLSRLITRIPDLVNLKFKDKLTPFADSDTIKWITDEVMISASAGGVKTKPDIVLPPIIGEEYSEINKEYEAACGKLPAGFEDTVTVMQQGIFTDTRRKGKFLRRLNLANYCFQAKEFNLAKVNLAELDKLIDEYNLSEWEPALCTAVWQTEYLTNTKIISEVPKDQIYILEKEQKELFSKIAKYNGVLALKLTRKK